MTVYESKTTTLNRPQSEIFNKFSDLSNVEPLKDKIGKQKAENIVCSSDYLTADLAQIGKISVRIVSREEYSKIGFVVECMSIEANMAMILQEKSADTTDIKIVVEAEIPFFIQPLVNSKLQKAVDYMVENIAAISNV